jgi:hypothetical protein
VRESKRTACGESLLYPVAGGSGLHLRAQEGVGCDGGSAGWTAQEDSEVMSGACDLRPMEGAGRGCEWRLPAVRRRARAGWW